MATESRRGGPSGLVAEEGHPLPPGLLPFLLQGGPAFEEFPPKGGRGLLQRLLEPAHLEKQADLPVGEAAPDRRGAGGGGEKGEGAAGAAGGRRHGNQSLRPMASIRSMGRRARSAVSGSTFTSWTRSRRDLKTFSRVTVFMYLHSMASLTG